MVAERVGHHSAKVSITAYLPRLLGTAAAGTRHPTGGTRGKSALTARRHSGHDLALSVGDVPPHGYRLRGGRAAAAGL